MSAMDIYTVTYMYPEIFDNSIIFKKRKALVQLSPRQVTGIATYHHTIDHHYLFGSCSHPIRVSVHDPEEDIYLSVSFQYLPVISIEQLQL